MRGWEFPGPFILHRLPPSHLLDWQAILSRKLAAVCIFNVVPESASSIAMASACKRHASVGLVPAAWT
jgi:hypothetical protein